MRGDQESEAIREKHSALALKLLEDAEQEIKPPGTRSGGGGGEKLWGATSQPLKAYCASHGLPHSRYAHRRRALLDLAERTGDGFLPWPLARPSPATLTSTTTGWSRTHLETYLPGIQRLVHLLLEAQT